MVNKFKVGDIIKIIDQSGGGKILSIKDDKAVILNQDGFEEVIGVNSIIISDIISENALRNCYIPDTPKQRSRKKKDTILFKSKSNDLWEIDLHIENLLDNYYHMSNYEIISYQLEKCEEIIFKAIQTRVRKLVIIHGKGQGVLRNEVHNLLQSLNLDFKDADYLKYSGGATDVFFR